MKIAAVLFCSFALCAPLQADDEKTAKPDRSPTSLGRQHIVEAIKCTARE